MKIIYQCLSRTKSNILGYVDVGTDYNVPINEYIVQDVHQDKYGRIWMTLYHLASNQSLYHINAKRSGLIKVKVNKNDLIIATFKQKEKNEIRWL